MLLCTVFILWGLNDLCFLLQCFVIIFYKKRCQYQMHVFGTKTCPCITDFMHNLAPLCRTNSLDLCCWKSLCGYFEWQERNLHHPTWINKMAPHKRQLEASMRLLCSFHSSSVLVCHHQCLKCFTVSSCAHLSHGIQCFICCECICTILSLCS